MLCSRFSRRRRVITTLFWALGLSGSWLGLVNARHWTTCREWTRGEAARCRCRVKLLRTATCRCVRLCFELWAHVLLGTDGAAALLPLPLSLAETMKEHREAISGRAGQLDLLSCSCCRAARRGTAAAGVALTVRPLSLSAKDYWERL